MEVGVRKDLPVPIQSFCLQRGLRGRWDSLPRNASVLQKWPLSGHLALSGGAKQKPRIHHFDQCLRGFQGWWALLGSNQ